MKLYYVHDPMCSWCWAFRPIYTQLLTKLPENIQLIKLLGGLAPDSDEPMPEKTKKYVISNWQQIEKEVPGTQFNYDFWTQCQPRRSTYPACRSVIAARLQGEQFDDLMTHAIQQAYYLNAMNPSDIGTLIKLASEIGCDAQQFEHDIHSQETDNLLKNELSTARKLQLNSFPGFLLATESMHSHIRPDYYNVETLLTNINAAALNVK